VGAASTFTCNGGVWSTASRTDETYSLSEAPEPRPDVYILCCEPVGMGDFRKNVAALAGCFLLAVVLLELSGFSDEIGVSVFDMLSLIPAWVAVPILGAVAVAWYFDP